MESNHLTFAVLSYSLRPLPQRGSGRECEAKGLGRDTMSALTRSSFDLAFDLVLRIRGADRWPEALALGGWAPRYILALTPHEGNKEQFSNMLKGGTVGKTKCRLAVCPRARDSLRRGRVQEAREGRRGRGEVRIRVNSCILSRWQTPLWLRQRPVCLHSRVFRKTYSKY